MVPCGEVPATLIYTRDGQIRHPETGLCLGPYRYMNNNGPGFVLAPCADLATSINGFAEQRFVIGPGQMKQRLTSTNGQCMEAASLALPHSDQRL